MNTPAPIPLTLEIPVMPKTLLTLLQELRPMADYGLPGTRDVDQRTYQDAIDGAIKLLESVPKIDSPVTPEGQAFLQRLKNEHTTWRDSIDRCLEAAEYINYFHQFLNEPVPPQGLPSIICAALVQQLGGSAIIDQSGIDALAYGTLLESKLSDGSIMLKIQLPTVGAH